MKHAAATRRELGLRTAFNLLGPLTNPVGPRRQIVGVPRPEHTELVARALLMLGSERVWVVHGADGLDEISTTGYTKVSECRAGAVHTFYVHPSDFGLAKATPDMLKGGNAAQRCRDQAPARRRTRGDARHRLLNAGAGLVAGKVSSVREGIDAANAAIDDASAARALDQLVRVTAPAPSAARMTGRRPICSRRSSLQPARACRPAASWCPRRRSRRGSHRASVLGISSGAFALAQRHRGMQAPIAVEGLLLQTTTRFASRGPTRAAPAISVLTEPTLFDGSSHLEAVRAVVGILCALPPSSIGIRCSKRERPAPTPYC